MPRRPKSRRNRHRQAAGRPGCRRNPRLPRPRSPTRARACAMPASTSPAKKARRSKEAPRWTDQAQRATAGFAARPRVYGKATELKANNRQRPPRVCPSAPHGSKNIYAQIIDDASGRTVCVRLDTRQGPEGVAEDRRRHGGCGCRRQADRRARAEGQGVRSRLRSRRLSSITAASRRSPTRPARVA